MHHTPAFLALINELERYQLPPRRRLRDGEAVAGRVKPVIGIRVAALAFTIPPTLTGTVDATIEMKGAARGRAGKLRNTVARAPKRRALPRFKAPKGERVPRVPGQRPKRSQEAKDAAAATVRANRQARVEVLLPLVAEARAHGCVLLREICAYLDKIGHPSPRGGGWNHTTLHAMIPNFAADRLPRDQRYHASIKAARDGGAKNNDEVAEWLNLNGYRTPRNKLWTGENVCSFEIRSRLTASTPDSNDQQSSPRDR